MRISRKGSYILEASVVFPVMVFAVITSVLIIMFFYSQATEQSIMHIALRSEAGKLTEKTDYIHAPDWDGEIYEEKGAAESEVYGKKYLIMKHRGLLFKKGTFVLEDRCSVLDGVKYVRYCDLVRGMGNER